ncbi:MAG: leucine-rich repeat domain-containing protein, partial [Psychrosphaera sp.]|nr:leucine-rich repeat domain-containing protein [Psychrosphaera sp.]
MLATELVAIDNISKTLNVELEKITSPAIKSRGYRINDAGMVTGLYLYKCKLNNLSHIQTDLAALPNLHTLWLDNNNIIDLNPLRQYTNLQSLGLNNNKIADITPLKNLHQLECIYLSINSISDLTPLINLTEIRHL